jgi:hypothetical protein
MLINSYDIDGVIYINETLVGVTPRPEDIIITGRSFEEEIETVKMLKSRGINNVIYFNPLPFNEKTRISSGIHKGLTLQTLISSGIDIGLHFEDDEIQIREIEKLVPGVNVVHIKHELTEKENIRRVDF